MLEAAFPDEDWKTGLERTRPYKQRRGLPAKVPEEQGTLFGAPAEPRTNAPKIEEKPSFFRAPALLQDDGTAVIESDAKFAITENAWAASFERTLEWEVARAWRGRG